MSETLKERKDMDPKYEWNLSTLFKNDEEFEKSLQACSHYVKDLAAYEGKLNNVEDILAFLTLNTEADRKLSNLYSYSFLRKTEDTRNSDALSMYSRAYGKVVEASTAAAFAEPEILANEEEHLKEIAANPRLKDYAFYLNNLIRKKEHMLSGKEEAVLASLGEVLNTPEQAAGALMDADMVFNSAKDSDGQEHEVTESSYILLQSSSDRELRRNAFNSFYKGYGQHINTFASTLGGCVKNSVVQSRLRGYASSRAMHMADDNIPESVYDNLISTVRSRMDLMYRYVKLRKRLLKLDDIHYYDLYAPLTSGVEKKYSYEEAQQMVKEAVAPLGNEYVDRVQQAFDERWIDVYPNKGKEGGAFSEGTYDSNPFIKMNFTGTLDSVSTLAHEMGHSQHTWLSNHTQPYQYSQYTMFVAEVASTVNENLLIEQLLKKETDPKERLALLNQYLESFKGTVYRQTMFAEFEKEAHAMCERGESLTADSLSSLYAHLIHDYFGDDLVMDDAVKYEWARIPHFYYLFYVYVYATGYSSACAISEKILSEGEPAVKKYLEFLSMGSSAYPLDELKHGGVDLTTPEPIDIALDKFEKVLEDAERTADQLGL